MNDVKITKKLKVLALIYLICLLSLAPLAMLIGESNGKLLMFMVWSILSCVYFFVYRLFAQKYKCKSTKFLALSLLSTSGLHGILYSCSAFMLAWLVLMGLAAFVK